MTSVTGAADLEFKNQYWIDLGIRREQERIRNLLQENDVWSAGFELGLLTERDRIIKLLEIWAKEKPYFLDVWEVIALIKGENK